MSESLNRGLLPREVAQRLRVSADKVRRWIASGELRAVNVAMKRTGRPRWIITPEALAEFETSRGVKQAPKAARRYTRPANVIQFF